MCELLTYVTFAISLKDLAKTLQDFDGSRGLLSQYLHELQVVDHFAPDQDVPGKLLQAVTIRQTHHSDATYRNSRVTIAHWVFASHQHLFALQSGHHRGS